jgi:hypothetical protein
VADIVQRKKFIPGSVVRVRGQLMGVGKASLLGLLDEAEDISAAAEADAKDTAVAVDVPSVPAPAGVEVEEPVDPEPTRAQKAAATRAANKAKGAGK